MFIHFMNKEAKINNFVFKCLITIFFIIIF